MTLPGSLRRYSNFVRVWGFLWYTNVSGLGPVLIKISCITKTVAESTILISANWMWIYINVSGLGPVKVNITCADQGIFIRGGGSRPDGKKTASTARKQPWQRFFFVCLFCVVLNLLTEGFNGFISERVYHMRISLIYQCFRTGASLH